MSLLTMLYLRVNIIIRICLMQNKPFDINEFRIGRLINYYNVDTKGKRGRQKMSVLFLCLFLYLFSPCARRAADLFHNPIYIQYAISIHARTTPNNSETGIAIANNVIFCFLFALTNI